MKRKQTSKAVTVQRQQLPESSLTLAQVSRIKRTFAEATSENTSRAYRADLAHYWAWAGTAPAYPIKPERLLAYLADHSESLSVATLTRRVAAISTAHRLQGIGPEKNPAHHQQVRAYLSALRRQASKAGKRPRKKAAATLDVLNVMLQSTTDGTLTSKRDAALLSLGFGSGGRRRSELTALQVGDVEQVPGGFLIVVRRSKTDQAGHGLQVPCRGRCADALQAWLAASGITSGFLFRSINRHGQLGESLSGQAVANIIKARALLAGLNPHQFAGHSLRSGFVTEAGRQGVHAPDAMALSDHRSMQVFAGYYRAGDVMQSKAGALMGQ